MVGEKKRRRTDARNQWLLRGFCCSLGSSLIFSVSLPLSLSLSLSSEFQSDGGPFFADGRNAGTRDDASEKAQLPWEIPGLNPRGPTSLVLSGPSPCQLYFHRDMFLAGCHV